MPPGELGSKGSIGRADSSVGGGIATRAVPDLIAAVTAALASLVTLALTQAQQFTIQMLDWSSPDKAQEFLLFQHALDIWFCISKTPEAASI